MRAWLGEPHQFQDPRYDTIGGRFSATRELGALVADLFADQTTSELVAEGQCRGVPIAAVLTPTEVVSPDHFRRVGALAEIEVGNGAHVAAPAGPFVVDAGRSGLRRPAPQAGAVAWL